MKPIFLLLTLAAPLAGAEIPSAPLAEKGVAIVAEKFDAAKLGPEWKAIIPTFALVDGAWKGSQTRSDHGAVGSVASPQPFSDAIIEFRFKLEGSTAFNAVCDDRNWRESHSGHILRVQFGPKIIRLGDDKEGAMKNSIRELREKPEGKAEADKLLKEHGAAFPITLSEHQWHQATIEIVGDQMRVVLDGKPAGYLKSSGLAHPSKTHFHWTVSGQDAYFDDLLISGVVKKSTSD